MSSGGSGFQGWPALAKAAYRGQQLRLEELYDGLLLIPEAFDVDECREMIRAVEATGELVSTNPRNLPPRKGHAFRNNERYLVRLAELPLLEPQPESKPPTPRSRCTEEPNPTRFDRSLCTNAGARRGLRGAAVRVPASRAKLHRAPRGRRHAQRPEPRLPVLQVG